MTDLTFVVPVMNRTRYIRETIGNNLERCREIGAKLLVLSYGDGAQLDRLIGGGFYPFDSGLLTFCRYEGNGYYCRSHSTNLAMLAADTKYVLDIASETMIHEAGAREVADVIAANDGGGDWWSYPFQVLTSQELFMRLGGYDETFIGWGWEDSDLLERAKKSGAREIRMVNGPKKWTHIPNKSRTSGFPSLFGNFRGTLDTNKRRAKARPFFQFANYRQLWGHGVIDVNFGEYRVRLGAYTNSNGTTSFKRREYDLPDDVVGIYNASHSMWSGDVEIRDDGVLLLGADVRGSWVYVRGCLTLQWDGEADDESLYQYAPGRLSSLCGSFNLEKQC